MPFDLYSWQVPTNHCQTGTVITPVMTYVRNFSEVKTESQQVNLPYFQSLLQAGVLRFGLNYGNSQPL